MKRNLKKRMAKKQSETYRLQQLEMDVSNAITGINNNLIRVMNLLGDQTRTLSKFPMTVRDFATDPPYHAGEYIIWFVRRGAPVQSRKYVYDGSSWFDQKGDRMDIKQYRPAMWMMLPVFGDDLLEIYRRRG